MKLIKNILCIILLSCALAAQPLQAGILSSAFNVAGNIVSSVWNGVKSIFSSPSAPDTSGQASSAGAIDLERGPEVAIQQSQSQGLFNKAWEKIRNIFAFNWLFGSKKQQSSNNGNNTVVHSAGQEQPDLEGQEGIGNWHIDPISVISQSEKPVEPIVLEAKGEKPITTQRSPDNHLKNDAIQEIAEQQMPVDQNVKSEKIREIKNLVKNNNCDDLKRLLVQSLENNNAIDIIITEAILELTEENKDIHQNNAYTLLKRILSILNQDGHKEAAEYLEWVIVKKDGAWAYKGDKISVDEEEEVLSHTSSLLNAVDPSFEHDDGDTCPEEYQSCISQENSYEQSDIRQMILNFVEQGNVNALKQYLEGLEVNQQTSDILKNARLEAFQKLWHSSGEKQSAQLECVNLIAQKIIDLIGKKPQSIADINPNQAEERQSERKQQATDMGAGVGEFCDDGDTSPEDHQSGVSKENSCQQPDVGSIPSMSSVRVPITYKIPKQEASALKDSLKTQLLKDAKKRLGKNVNITALIKEAYKAAIKGKNVSQVLTLINAHGFNDQALLTLAKDIYQRQYTEYMNFKQESNYIQSFIILGLLTCAQQYALNQVFFSPANEVFTKPLICHTMYRFEKDPALRSALLKMWISYGLPINSKIDQITLLDFAQHWHDEELANWLKGKDAKTAQDLDDQASIADFDMMSTALPTIDELANSFMFVTDQSQDVGLPRAHINFTLNTEITLDGLSRYLDDLAIHGKLNNPDLWLGTTPLHYILSAIQDPQDKERLLNQLLARDVDPNTCDENGIAPISIAIKNNEPTILAKLFEKGARLNARIKVLPCDESTWCTPLILALMHNNNECVELLLDHGVNVDQCETQRRTMPAHWAIINKSPHLEEILKKLEAIDKKLIPLLVGNMHESSCFDECIAAIPEGILAAMPIDVAVGQEESLKVLRRIERVKKRQSMLNLEENIRTIQHGLFSRIGHDGTTVQDLSQSLGSSGYLAAIED